MNIPIVKETPGDNQWRPAFVFLPPFCYHDGCPRRLELPHTSFRGPAGVAVLALAAINFARVPAMADIKSRFDSVLLPSIEIWKKAGPSAIYTPETLSTYIDGGAELYISYGFLSSLATRYEDETGREITVDIFDMGSSYDAYGVFAHSRESVAADFGQGSEYASGLLTFWKDRYYVAILAYPEGSDTLDIVTKLGRAIEGAIPGEGALPPIIGRLPAEGLMPETVRYFHHYVWLNSFHFVSNDNVLDIERDTPVALARYKRAGKSYMLLLVRFPDKTRVEAAAARFRTAVLGGAADGMKALGDGRWAGLRVLGDMIGVVLGAPDGATVGEALAQLEP